MASPCELIPDYARLLLQVGSLGYESLFRAAYGADREITEARGRGSLEMRTDGPVCRCCWRQDQTADDSFTRSNTLSSSKGLKGRQRLDRTLTNPATDRHVSDVHQRQYHHHLPIPNPKLTL